MAKRREITETLTMAALMYWTKKKYAVYKEIGIERWGRQRADLLAVSLKGDLVIVEVKSGYADYKADCKWPRYLGKAHRFYFAISESLYLSKHGKLIAAEAKEKGAGVMVLDSKSGFMRVKVKSKRFAVTQDTVFKLVLKMAWRHGFNASNTRRRRQYL
jgi:hypothetical protein